jgi:hypothetical protein
MTHHEIAILRADLARHTEAMERLAPLVERLLAALAQTRREPTGLEGRGA